MFKFKYLVIIILLLFVSCRNSYIDQKPLEEKEINTALAKELSQTDSLAQISEDITKNNQDTLVIKGEVLPNVGMFDDLLAMGLNNRQALELINVLSYNVDLRFIKAGEELTLYVNKDTSKVYKFIYKPNIVTKHIVYYDANSDSLKYKEEILPYEKKYRLIKGFLKTTLDEALSQNNLSNALKNEITNALECKISFRFDARVGDQFTALVEEYYYNDVKFGGKALYASYLGKRTGFFEAYWYEDADKSSYNGFYTPNGEALINNALRYPLDRILVVSSFGWRVHPVLGVKKFHNGVDFRAAVGTPVYAAAKGKVILTGYDPYSGKKIVIRHLDGTETYYLHLSKILVRKGQTVKARQIIARAGATGRVTGPHVHFGIKAPNGKWADPLRKRMIAVTKLKGERLEKYNLQKEFIKSLLQKEEFEKNFNRFARLY